MPTTLKRHWLRIAAHLACLVPAALLALDYARDNLTFNPIQEATQRTGKTALVILLLSLACTPLNTLFGLRQALPLRRPLGLYAFAYASIHLLIFLVVDYGLDLAEILRVVAEKRYVLVGFAAFLLLLPLALTSNRAAMRRLGQRWKALHRLVYLAAGLAVVHFIWLVKADVREPLAYGAAVALLLSLRLPAVRRRLSSLRARRKSAADSPELPSTQR
jgi:methionine sulfoxide reductase heme-binding subunit